VLPRHAELIADFRAMLAEGGVEVVVAGASVRGLVSEPELGQQIDLGGLVPEADLSVKVLKIDLPPTPLHGKIANVDGEDYRVTTIRRRPSSPFVTLDLDSPDE